MTMVLERLRCDHIDCIERRDTLTMQEALEQGWVFLKTADGDWDYCSPECLEKSLNGF